MAVGYGKVAKLAAHYGVSSNWLLCLSNDPSMVPTAADELDLSASVVEGMKRFRHNTSIGKDGIEGLNLLIEKGYFLELAWRIKMLRDHVADYVELSSKYKKVSDDADYRPKRIWDEIDIAEDIEKIISSQHPEYLGRFRVFTGYRFIAAEKREIVDDFEKMLREISGFDHFLAELHNGGSWL